MIYLSGHASKRTEWPQEVGVLVQPSTLTAYATHFSSVPVWAADTGLFNGDVVTFSMADWLVRLGTYREQGRCAFVTARDIVCDPAATDAFAAVDIPLIRAAGWPAAYIGQDGATELPDCDALFIGGSTKWKCSDAARALVRAAQRRGLWVHMGRVNSRPRWIVAKSWGCDSVDGTYLAFGPDTNWPKLTSWIQQGVLRL